MTLLQIDTDEALVLVGALRTLNAGVEPILQLITQAEQLSDLATTTCLALDEVGHEALRTAEQIDTALTIVDQFRLRLLPTVLSLFGPDDRHVQAPPLWDAAADRPWNQVHQVASHNSYAEPGGIAALYDEGVRTFELDIHRGAPTDFTPYSLPLIGIGSAVAIALDHLDHDGARADDWRVYHTSAGPESEYLYLSDGIAAVTSLATSDPLTIFVDNKDAFGGTHTSAAFDQLLDETIGDRLYTPSEMIARAPGALSVRQAVAMAGWPTVTELEGRILVVLTDEVDGYDTTSARSFVAPSPQFARDSDGVAHQADDDVVFYNVDARWFSSDEHLALQSTATVVRTYFDRSCPADEQSDIVDANYQAVDFFEHQARCAPADVKARNDLRDRAED